MKIRVTDIPKEGIDVKATVESAALEARANAPWGSQKLAKAATLPLRFAGQAMSNLNLRSEGNTVYITGTGQARLYTHCARCLTEIDKLLSFSVEMVLKPKPIDAHAREDCEEDLAFGYYDGEEIDCGELLEEFTMLNVPFALFCEDTERDMCSTLTSPEDLDPVADESRFPFRVLQQLKLQ